MPFVKCSFLNNVTWLPAATSEAVAGGVAVWRLQLSASFPFLEKAGALLDAAEQERAGRYQREQDRQRFVLSRAVLRCILGSYMQMSPGEIRFATGANKKPYVLTKETDLQFNIAHAGDRVLIAVSGRAVGIDTENTNSAQDYSDITGTCFNASEVDYIGNAADRNAAFYTCWTRKEALVKATGKGIDDDLRHIPCLDGTHNVTAQLLGSDQDWEVLTFAVDAANTGSLAYPPECSPTSFYDAAALLAQL